MLCRSLGKNPESCSWIGIHPFTAKLSPDREFATRVLTWQSACPWAFAHVACAAWITLRSSLSASSPLPPHYINSYSCFRSQNRRFLVWKYLLSTQFLALLQPAHFCPLLGSAFPCACCAVRQACSLVAERLRVTVIAYPQVNHRALFLVVATNVLDSLSIT